MENVKARVIAYYLPQFHPCEINDRAWGKGFTEWRNVAQVRPLYPGHYQPQLPADLGFYDLRVPEVREQQAEMARSCGVEGFCYWHYWFGNGKTALTLPFQEVLKTGSPDFPFCIGWANHTWRASLWDKKYQKLTQADDIIVKQEYPGDDDYKEHFYKLLPAFLDKRYIRVEDKPLFLIFNADDLPDAKHFIDLWQGLARKNGLKGIHFVAKAHMVKRAEKFDKLRNRKDWAKQADEIISQLLEKGFDAVNADSYERAQIVYDGFSRYFMRKIKGYLFPMLPSQKYDYARFMKGYHIEQERREEVYPTIVPRFDKTPRVGNRAVIYAGSTPEKFADTVRVALDMVKDKDFEKRIIFLQSWNEWGEGNYMEPDLKWGGQYVKALKSLIVCEKM